MRKDDRRISGDEGSDHTGTDLIRTDHKRGGKEMKLEETGLTFEDIKEKVNKYMIETYERMDFLAESAKDQYIYNEKGEKYLDFYAEAAYRKYAARIARLSPDLIIPVPVHKSRMKKRGFNQAEEFGKRLSHYLEIPMNSSLLIRSKKTVPQKDLGPALRLKNLEQAFSCRKLPYRMKKVLLIDDIYTTGSTAEACSRALKKAGAEQVFLLVIATSSNR